MAPAVAQGALRYPESIYQTLGKQPPQWMQNVKKRADELPPVAKQITEAAGDPLTYAGGAILKGLRGLKLLLGSGGLGGLSSFMTPADTPEQFRKGAPLRTAVGTGAGIVLGGIGAPISKEAQTLLSNDIRVPPAGITKTPGLDPLDWGGHVTIGDFNRYLARDIVAPLRVKLKPGQETFRNADAIASAAYNRALAGLSVDPSAASHIDAGITALARRVDISLSPADAARFAGIVKDRVLDPLAAGGGMASDRLGQALSDLSSEAHALTMGDHVPLGDLRIAKALREARHMLVARANGSPALKRTWTLADTAYAKAQRIARGIGVRDDGTISPTGYLETLRREFGPSDYEYGGLPADAAKNKDIASSAYHMTEGRTWPYLFPGIAGVDAAIRHPEILKVLGPLAAGWGALHTGPGMSLTREVLQSAMRRLTPGLVTPVGQVAGQAANQSQPNQ
jgi:hypothetical protein